MTALSTKGLSWINSLLGNPTASVNPENRLLFLEFVHECIVNKERITVADIETLYQQACLPEEQESDFITLWYSNYEIIKDYVSIYVPEE